jgi:hypothetical protein
VGRVSGDTPGWATLEIEQRGPVLAGIAYHYPDDPEITCAAVEFTMGSDETHVVRAGLPTIPFRPHDGTVFRHDEIASYFPNSMISPVVDLDFRFDGNEVQFTFVTPPAEDHPGSAGSGSMLKGHIRPSELVPTVMSWKEFRAFAFTPDRNRYIYRGQTFPWRLRTTFHRSPRKNLQVYRHQLVPEARNVLSGQLPHSFDMAHPDQVGSFYNLLQHHGYPTPLLDWSWSPFIAAYFAFEGARAEREGAYVRLFVFDRAKWAELRQSNVLGFTALHFSIVDLASFGNCRAVPQQACVTLTNIDDIENYIAFASSVKGVEYLRAFDIPVTDRKEALDDLALMGIHHGSLFPGIDGTCRALAYRHFGV